jgi:amidase
MTDTTWLDATAQAELVRSGQASPLELVDAAIERVERVNPQLNAVIHPLFESARERAKEKLPDGPFRGVPVLFKDLFAEVAGDPYNEGTKFLKDLGYRSGHTDALAQRYFDAGFVCIGRTNTPEFGLVPTTEPEAHGATRNPWDTSRTPGGSSGGSAAAVASGMVPLAHGNDGGGSIRIPASCCGLVGLKPSRGRTSLAPEWGHLTNPLIAELCVSRTVRDTAAVLDALGRPSPGDPVVAPPPLRLYVQEVGAHPGALRIGILTENTIGTGGVHPQCVAATEAAGRLLESLGHHVEPGVPKAFEQRELVNHFTVLWVTELADIFRYWERKIGRDITPADVEPLTWSLAESGRTTTAQEFLDALHALQDVSRSVAEWWESGFDLLLTPTLGEPPVPLGTFNTPDEPILGFARAATFVPFTPPFNMTGQPAISVPLAWSDDPLPLPIGVQLVAAYGREDLLLQVAAQLEAAAPWIDRRPAVHA